MNKFMIALTSACGFIQLTLTAFPMLQ